MATARSSTLYSNYVTNKYVPDARDLYGRVVPIYFNFTAVSVSATGDTYQLFVLPANASVIGLFCTTQALSVSAGVGLTVKIGDSGDDDRYMAATDFDAVNAQGYLAYAGVAYRPTSDTIVVATVTGVMIVGTAVKGHFLIVPAS